MTVTEITRNASIQNPVRYCIDIILKEARKEDRLVRQILYAILSAYTNNPINLAINSPTGEGKSYVLTKVAEMFPEEDVIFVSHMTEKALFHRSGEYVQRNESGQYVSIDILCSEIDSKIQDKEDETNCQQEPKKRLEMGNKRITKGKEGHVRRVKKGD